MIDNILNLLFRCSHQRMTRPITPHGKGMDRSAETYVVCLDCGKRFLYDLEKMSIRPRSGRKLRYAAIAAGVPLAAWLWRRSSRKPKNPSPG
jgi:hypothetical protein